MDIRGLAAAIFIFIFPFFVFGQQVLSPTEISDPAIDDIGSRRTTRPTETFSKDDLKTDERPQLDDALNTIPGVQARLTGSPLLSIRGSESSARALVLEEGVPLNFSDGVGFNPLLVASENLGAVTLLRGASSSLFGHDAMAGVLEFKTEKLKTPKFYASDGSFNSTEVFMGAPLHFNGVEAQSTVFESHTDGNFPFSMPRIGVGGIRQSNDGETLRATIQAQDFSHESFQWKTFNLFAQQIGSIPGSVTFPSTSAFNNWGELSSLSFSSKLSDKYSVGSRTSFKYLSQTYSGSSTGITTGLRQGISATDKIGESQLELFDDFDFDQFQASYLPSNPQSVTINEGGLSGLTPLNEFTTLSAALRVSNENSSFAPSLGMEGLAEGNWKYFMNYSEGYHPPSVTQLYAQFPGFSGNPGLQSEHSYEVDLGFEKQFEKINIHFEAFDRETSNLVENKVLVAGTETPQNVGRARADGFELRGHLDGEVELQAGVGYLENLEIDTGNPVPLSPQVQASLSARKRIGNGSIELQDTYWTNYYDRDVTTGILVPLNNWNTLDFFAEYILFGDTRLKVTILNIFDQARELSIGYPEPQRSYSVMLVSYL